VGFLSVELNLAQLSELDRARNQRSGGIKALRRYLTGHRLTLRGAVKAKCCECMCYYEDGGVDCRNPVCPLYPWMPYRREEATNP
jgi:hypothetical protein